MSDLRTHITLRKMQRGARDEEIHRLYYHAPYLSEAAVLIEIWNAFQKTQLLCQLFGSILEGRGRVSQKLVYALNHCPIHSTVSPVARIHKSSS